MDISLSENRNGTKLEPISVHGILWLQTHFEDAHWGALASKQVRIPTQDAKMLSIDASEAGLIINYLPSLSIARKS